MGPVVTKEAEQRIRSLIDSGIEQGAKLVVDGRDFKLQGYEKRPLHRRLPLRRRRHPTWDIYKTESSDPSCRVVRARNYEEAPVAADEARIRQRCRHLHPRTAMRPRTSPPASISAWSASMFRSRFRSPTIPSAAGNPRPSRPQPAWPDSIKFWTRTKDESRPAGRPDQGWRAEFSIPTMRITRQRTPASIGASFGRPRDWIEAANNRSSHWSRHERGHGPPSSYCLDRRLSPAGRRCSRSCRRFRGLLRFARDFGKRQRVRLDLTEGTSRLPTVRRPAEPDYSKTCSGIDFLRFAFRQEFHELEGIFLVRRVLGERHAGDVTCVPRVLGVRNSTLIAKPIPSARAPSRW